MKVSDISDFIRKIVIKETIWLRHYIGEVVDINDPQKEGRVLCVCLDLGISSGDEGFWCAPRGKNSISTPAIGDWIEFYFVNGSPDMPVYMGVANEIKDMLPKNYDKKNTTHIIFEDPGTDKSYIKYDATKKEFSINGDDDNAVRFSKLQEAFDELKSDMNIFITTKYNIHSHPTAPPGAVSPPSVTGSSSSADISSAKIEEIKVKSDG